MYDPAVEGSRLLVELPEIAPMQVCHDSGAPEPGDPDQHSIAEIRPLILRDLDIDEGPLASPDQTSELPGMGETQVEVLEVEPTHIVECKTVGGLEECDSESLR